MSKTFKHTFNPSNAKLLVSTTMFLFTGFPLCRYFIEYFLSPLSHCLTLLDLSLIVILHVLVPLRDYLFLHKPLCLLELSVPVLEFRETTVNIRRTHVSPEALSHVELLSPLIKLPLDQLVVDAVDDQVLKFTHVVDF